MMKCLVCGVALLAIVVTGPGCSELSSDYDCRVICDRYKDCFDSDYDADSCFNRCDANASGDNATAERANECQACIEDRSCSESFGCATECVGIVP